MGEVIRDGIFYPDLGQVIIPNPSLQRQPSPYFSVRMKGLSQIGHDADTLIYGDELTWDDIEALKIPWGNSELQRYSNLEPNYSYVWNIGTRTFSVADASGNAISFSNIKSISDLGISWDILESHQFIILLTASYDWDAFLISKKINPENISDSVSYIWGQGDAYVKGATHFLPGAIRNRKDAAPGETAVGVHQSAECRVRQILLSKALALYASGRFPSNMDIQIRDRIANRLAITHSGTNTNLGKLLMVHMFTSNKMIGTFPDSYPWMLFKTFRWLWDDDNSGQPYDPNGPGEARIYDRTFDLSPWWG
jgi:hypothetical protein